MPEGAEKDRLDTRGNRKESGGTESKGKSAEGKAMYALTIIF
jgi:hypothetical protein